MQSFAFIIAEETELKRSCPDLPNRLSGNFVPAILADWSDFETACGRVSEVEMNVVQKHRSSLSRYARHCLAAKEQGNISAFGDEVDLIRVAK